MHATCTNADCGEHGIAKTVDAVDPDVTEILCGACGEPCELAGERDR